MVKFSEYTKDIASHLNEKYNDLVENIFANDVAYDLSIGEKPDSVYLNRSVGINRYYRSTDKGIEIFNYVFDLMKIKEK